MYILSSECMPLEDQQTQDCLYISNLCNSRNLDNILSTKVSLLPLDLQKQLEAKWAREGKTTDKYGSSHTFTLLPVNLPSSVHFFYKQFDKLSVFRDLNCV